MPAPPGRRAAREPPPAAAAEGVKICSNGRALEGVGCSSSGPVVRARSSCLHGTRRGQRPRRARVGSSACDRRLPVVRLVDLRETPLDVAEVLAALDDAAAGGLTLFVGPGPRPRRRPGRRPGSTTPRTRPRSTGSREVCDRVAERVRRASRVAAVHRVGPLAIGDIAVVVATAAAHRGEAFDASRALIDTLKAEVPIWKHQVFGDGTEEWVGSPVADAVRGPDRRPAAPALPSLAAWRSCSGWCPPAS